ncbi:MAG: hypothetical protein K0M58_01285 [Thiobacillus sp.]|nr:hypothetical protein [Thiobacillus sp.]
MRAVLWRSALFALLRRALTGGRTDSWGGTVSILAAVVLSLRLPPPAIAASTGVKLNRPH